MSGERIRTLRYAREVVDDLHWRGMAVPPVYASMAEEFQAMVGSGAYAAWLAGSGTPQHHAASGRAQLRR